MQSLALVIHVVLAVVVIGLVLMQHGKGADAGAAFGSGASATVFGARGSGSFLARATTIAATLFFLTSLALFYMAANRDGAIRSVTDTGSSSVTESGPTSSDLPGGVGSDDSELAAPAADGASEDATPASSGADSELPKPAE